MEKVKRPNRNRFSRDSKYNKMNVEIGILDKNGIPIKTGDHILYGKEHAIVLWDDYMKEYRAGIIRYCYGDGDICLDYNFYDSNSYYVMWTLSPGVRMEIEVLNRFKKPIKKKNLNLDFYVSSFIKDLNLE